MNNIVIAGAGTFGTAVAERLAWNVNNRVTLHTIEKDVEKEINDKHTNRKYFPTRFLNRYLSATSDLTVFREADVVMLVIPSKAIVPFSEEIRKNTQKEPLIINLAKGMSDSGAFITENIPFKRTASMKGPSFAIETINGFPTSFTFGGKKEDYDYFRKQVLPDTQFSLDYSDDVRAVELMSILKNMYAIAIGIVSGKFNSPNVDFLVYTKAVNEMRGLLKIFSCSEDTIFRYCGIGDLGLTALNDLSRNRTLGMLIGKGFGYGPDSKSSTVVEGLRTVKLIGEITRQKGVAEDFPLVQSLYRLLYENDTLNNYTLSVLG